jgi:chemotaxis response regulator CheB
MRIAIVNDVPTAAEILQRAVLLHGQHEVAWIAQDGAEAVEKCLKDTPDLILMDLIMPKLNGVQATRIIMRECPCAILVVTCSVNDNAQMVFEAMGAGALDAVDTPALGSANFESVGAPLLVKINSMNRLLGIKAVEREETQIVPPLVVIGASAGGPSALAAVLSRLPKNFPSPVVIIQHVDEQFAPALVHWLKQQSVLPLRAACDGDVPTPGEVLMAVKDEHLVMLGRRVGYTIHPKDAFYRPSVDVFFESCARRWAGNVIGVLLTGMGRDGGKGLKALRDAGFHTIAQDKASCAVYGMPKAAVELKAAVEVLPLDSIAPRLSKLCLGF